jgi:hypothetical protein
MQPLSSPSFSATPASAAYGRPLSKPIQRNLLLLLLFPGFPHVSALFPFPYSVVLLST